MENGGSNFLETAKSSFLILLFELLGTMFLAALYNSAYYTGDVTGLFCGFFILLIFSARISGSHFNPAVTLSFMFRKDVGRFSRILGILYIVAQYGGAILGAQISFNIFGAKAVYNDVLTEAPITVLKGGAVCDDKLIVQAIVFECLGSMLLTFLYLTQTEEKTKLSGDPAITTIIIAATYTLVVSAAYSPGGFICAGSVSALSPVSSSPFNPALAFGEALAIIFSGKYKNYHELMKPNMWVFFIFSYAGSLVAVLLFEFVYKKSLSAIEEAREEDSDKEEEQLLNNNI